MKTKGLLVFVYRNGSDCTANGISSKHDQLILIGDNIPEIFEGDETNTVKLVKRQFLGSEYLHVEPITERPFEAIGPMVGGNFIFSSDRSFPSQQPISVHDRFEVQSKLCMP